MNGSIALDELFDDPRNEPALRALHFHPLPVPCMDCGTILEATHAAENRFSCPTCFQPVCYTCGCTTAWPCALSESTRDGARSTVRPCFWVEGFPGICSSCLSRAAYELFMEATGRRAADPYYLSRGRSAFGVKGLGYFDARPTGGGR